jgi:integrase/recombinase XerD
MHKDISVNFILEGTKPKSDGSYPIKLNVYSKDIGQKRFGIKLSTTKENWNKLNNRKLRDDKLKTLNLKLEAIRQEALQVIDTLVVFSFKAFEKGLFSNDQIIDSKSSSLQVLFDQYILTLKNNEQIGTAISYQTTINSINLFRKDCSVHDITESWLQEYEDHLAKESKSISTIGIYMRQLRAVVNKAIEDKIVPRDNYPFRKYQVPSGRNVKKALSNEDLKKLLAYTPTDPKQQEALGFWKLSYFCNGINFTDIAHLKKAALGENFFHFYREKTKRTKKRDLRPIKVAINQAANQIIDCYRNNDPANPYLFSILTPGLTSLSVKHRCQSFVKWVNKNLEDVRKDLKIKQKLSTYAARHSFSTILLRKGVSVSFIKESLGHSSVITTENYLDSFEDSTKLQYSNLLNDL